MTTQSDWVTVCGESDIAPDTGVCALLDDEQVAIFKERKANGIYAISNFDPIGGANVLSRGIIGSIGERLVVASPLYKQHFCLKTGECLEQEVKVKTYPARIHEGQVQVAKS